MALHTFTELASVRKQRLLTEFASLKYACPYGVYLSLTPGDPTLWSGVLFVRKGPYSSSILRFHISFPPTYPSLPPLVTFSTDMFHPLITPLTTYMYTTDVPDNGTVSATDEERLPPGGFSLRHGFPAWFGRASRRSATQRTPVKGSYAVGSGMESSTSTPESTHSQTSSASASWRQGVSTYEVLRYIRNAFDDEGILDAVPLEAAGNPGAWHAWRTYRIKAGKIADHVDIKREQAVSSNVGGDDVHRTYAPTHMEMRKPGEWDWDGVWEERVRKGIDGSLADSVLYGGMAGDDLIRFLNMEEAEVRTITENLKRSADAAEPQRRTAD